MSLRHSIDPSAQVLEHNRQAMDLLKSGDYEGALSLLKQAESHLGTLPSLWKLQAITYNNLGCFYKKTRDLSTALGYLQLALEVEQRHPEDYTNIAGTHLNLCAVFSQSGRHKQALKQCQRALQVLKAHFQRSPNLVTTMAIAFHNIGVEFEYLRLRKPAGEAYCDGWEFAKKELGASHPLTSSLRRSFQACMDQRPLLEAPGILPPLDFTPPKAKAVISTRVSPLFHQQWEALPLMSSRSDEKRKPNGSRANRSFEESIGRYAFPKSSSPILGGNLRFISGDRKQPMYSQYTTPPVKPKPPDSRFDPFSKVPYSQRSSSIHNESLGAISERTPQASPGKLAVRTKAAIVIQRFVRGFTARQRTRKLKDDQQRQKIEAAGEMAKKALEEVHKLRAELHQSNPHIPKKPAKPRTKPLTPILEESTAKAAAVTIQSAVRMFLLRKQFLRKREAAVAIQQWWKVWSVRALYRSIRDAIVFIQACYRGYRVRRNHRPTGR